MFERIITKLDRTDDANKACNWNSLNFGNINISHNEGNRRTSTCRAEHTWSSLPIQRNASDIPQCHCTQGRNIACSQRKHNCVKILVTNMKNDNSPRIGGKESLAYNLMLENWEWWWVADGSFNDLMQSKSCKLSKFDFFQITFQSLPIHDNAGGSPRLSTGFCSPACLLSIPRPRWGASPLQMSLNLI